MPFAWFTSYPNWLFVGLASLAAYLVFRRKKEVVIAPKNQVYEPEFTEYIEKPKKIEVITTQYDCKVACETLQKHCKKLSALGFDCEWVNEFGAFGAKKGPVALLQLASFKGFCYLFRLNFLSMPVELQEILEDPNIIKLGVGSLNDARLLYEDYYVKVSSTLDLRHLYPTIPGGLAGLSKSILGITLMKDSLLPCSDWKAFELSQSQQFYAAMDAHVAIEIFKNWLNENNTHFSIYPKIFHYESRLYGFYNRHFKTRLKTEKAQNSSYIQESVNYSKNSKTSVNGHQIRKKPLYHNCFMHAPDGELLCSCDRRKAEWYIERGLAEVFMSEPFSIRLLFEPAARANEQNEGRFYQQLKQNCCVKCGAVDSYLRYNVVPREYRKYFPKAMKEHQSHDVVLLCPNCHQLASFHARSLKQKLAELCDAPFSNSSKVKGSENHALTVKNYAKALLKSGENIPFAKKEAMEKKIKDFFNVTDLTKSVLQSAAALKIKTENESSTHGIKVIEHFKCLPDGLIQLERLWRAQFLKTMQPKFLPALWSITHNHSRLMSIKSA